MGKYIAKRIASMIPVILGVSFLVYFFMEMAPGNMIDMAEGELTAEEIQALYHQYGYDRSVFYRYFLYLKNLFRGNLGTSYVYGTAVSELWLQRFPKTLELAAGAVLLSVFFSLPLGILAAAKHGSFWDRAIGALSVLGLSMPNFWLGVLFMLLFSRILGWLPSGGDSEGLKSLILPALTLSSGLMAQLTRTTRSGVRQQLEADYLRTARAKGLKPAGILGKHALKNALIPILTVAGSQFGGALGGAVITENVFSWPGVGRLLVDAVKERDTVLVCGCLILTAFFISLVQLLVDLLYGVVNPRVRDRMQGEAGGRRPAE